MKFIKLLSILLLFNGIVLSSFGQTKESNCPNSDFSYGNFSNWEGYYGSFWMPALHHGFKPTRHVIIAAPGTWDPHTCDSLLTVPPGVAYSARLGNDSVWAQGEQLRYSLTVTPETNLFIYKYAVVLEDPGHKPNEQPSFTIEIRNENGEVFDSTCGYYYVYAPNHNHILPPGWSTCNMVVWKDWTTVGMDLTPYMGQNITIVFTTRDCSQNAHFGYAYLSASCGKLQMAVNYCLYDSSATLTAPAGFTYLWNTGDTTQSLIVPNPSPGTIKSCLLTSVNGCQVTIQASLFQTVVKSDFSYVSECPYVPIVFNDSSTVNQNAITNWTWNFGDGSLPVTNIQNPAHAYENAGTYNVTLIAYSSEGCCDTIVKPVTVYPKVNSDFSYTPKCVNFSIPFSDLSTISQDTIVDRKWDFGDGSLPVTTILNPTHIYENPGTYNVSLIAYSSRSCSDTIIKPISVYPLPLIKFYQNTSLITTPSIVLCPFDTIILNTSNCGSYYEWKKKSEPDWFSDNQSIELSNPGMGIYAETYYLKVTNITNCISMDSLQVLWDFSGCYGINEHKDFISNIFPNPATGWITIELEQNYSISSIELCNIEGQVLYTQKYNNFHTNQLSLNLAKYQRGVYYLKISLNDSFEIKKIILY